MPSVRLIAGLAIVAATVAACKSTPPAPPVPEPTSIVLSAGSVTIDAIGAPVSLTATVRDQDGNAMANQTITWAVADATIATVGSTGATVSVTAVKNGATTVTATSSGLTAQATVTVEQVATQIVKISGDAQTGEVGDTLAQPLVVEIRDRRGNMVPGATGGLLVNTQVNFAATAGGGAFVAAAATVGTNGQASGLWILGGPAGAQGASASLSTNSASVSFAATGTAAAADSLIIASGKDQQGAAGSPLTDSVVAQVVDRFGNGVSGWTVDFAANGAGASVSPTTVNTGSGGLAKTQWTLGPTVGAQTLTVTAQALTKGSPATVNATAVDPIVSTLAKYEGDAQIGLVGKALNIPPAVKVTDQFGNGVAGVVVTFAVTLGAGSVTGAVDTTGADGVARVGSWFIDGAAGPNALSASATGLTAVEFAATGQAAAFDIVVRYFGAQAPTASQQAAFTAAEQRWESLIYGDIQGATVNAPAGSCDLPDLPAVNETVDDVLIYAKVDSIDGAGGILGRAGPCFIRSAGSTHPALTALGVMQFDRDDLASLEANGQLNLVILHEMGHVLGYGTLWNVSPFSLLTGAGSADPYFNGAQANAAFDRVGGLNYVAGPSIPVENTGGQGTRDAHWRESVFDRELMTGFLDPGTNAPLSITSVGSLWDMNYLVNYADADSYVLPSPPAALRGYAGQLEMKDDIYRGPITVIDPDGRVVGVFPAR